MQNIELKCPEWRTALDQALLEPNRDKLAEKLQKAERLILERLLQLYEENNGVSEREAIQKALPTLRMLWRDSFDYHDRD